MPQGLTDSRPLLFMPRANFAWDVKGNGNTIVRGGGGIFYVREQGNAQYDIINVPPNSFASTLDAGSLQNAFGGQGLNYSTVAQFDPFSGLNAVGEIRTPNPFDLNWPRTYNASVGGRAAPAVAADPRGQLRRHLGPQPGGGGPAERPRARHAEQPLLDQPAAARGARRQRLQQLQAVPDAVRRPLSRVHRHLGLQGAAGDPLPPVRQLHLPRGLHAVPGQGHGGDGLPGAGPDRRRADA